MSQKTIAQKLFIKEGNRILFLNQPEDYLSAIGDLPKNIVFSSESEGSLDFIQVFVKNKAELEAQLPKLKKKMSYDGKLWVSYYKGTSKNKTDINRDNLRKYAQSTGLKTVAMISINKDWSAMRLKITDS
ncbi:hypothetical protein LCGC14_0412990 [marine sediment metagenome]|uniref:DUF3052 domain-containing protein n=1 Tax=marine sediment metagenome TaxID=412755 RepID=A0A0F9STC2_9ZZZZ